MNDFKLIDDYLNDRLSPEERTRFEATLRTDPALADSLAFYLASRKAARAEAVAGRHAEWEALRKTKNRQVPFPPLTRRIGLWTAAAGLFLALGLGWYFTGRPAYREVAEEYIRENLTQLPVAMAASGDSLQRGIRLYNEGRPAEAGRLFEAVLQREPGNAEALKLAGLVSLRTGKYDQAVDQFQQLGRRTDLYANAGPFYEALTRLRRQQPLDKERAEELLKAVIENNLEGRRAAEELIRKLN